MDNTYQIQQGDTLSGIAQKYGTDVGVLSALNSKNNGAIPDPTNPNLILAGGNLTLPGQNKLITTSAPARIKTAQASSDLATALRNAGVSSAPSIYDQGTAPTTPPDPSNPDTATVLSQNKNDPLLMMLDKMQGTSDDATKALISSLQAAKQNNLNSVNTQFDKYKSGLQLLGIQSNMSEASPDLLLGHINQAENEHQQKIQNIDFETAKAISEANSAQADKKLGLFKEKMDYVRQLKQDKQDEIKKLYETLTATKGIADNQASAIYDQLQALHPDDQEKFLQRVAEKYRLPLSSLVTAVADEKLKRSDKGVERQKNLLDLENTRSIISERARKGATTASVIKFTPAEKRTLNTQAGLGVDDVKFIEGKLNTQSPDIVYQYMENKLKQSLISSGVGQRRAGKQAKAKVNVIKTIIGGKTVKPNS